MASKTLTEIIAEGPTVWNEWRKQNADIQPDLRAADLLRADLTGINLSNADLRGADLRFAILDRSVLDHSNLTRTHLGGAKLEHASLRNATLIGTHLHGAEMREATLNSADARETDFRGTVFSDANLAYANLSGSRLSGAKFFRANLVGTNFTAARLADTKFHKATVGYTIFASVDLANATGLEQVHHWGPSVIAVDTLYRSAGKIPEIFLRGAGVPDGLIIQLPSLLGAEEGFHFYSCFISYSHKDQAFAQRLHSRMRDEHLRVWFAPEDIKGGEKIHEQIETQIHIYDKLLLVLSQSSMNSQWVATEIYHARRREFKERRQILFPIALCDYQQIADWKSFDADSGKDMARDIREYFIPDFSNWKNRDAFEQAFGRLLDDLRAKPT